MLWWWIGWSVVLTAGLAALLLGGDAVRGWAGWIAMLLVLSLGTLVWLAVPNYARAAGSGDPCPEQPAPSPKPPRSPGIAPVPLVLEEPEGAAINFLRDRASHSRTVYLQVAKKNLAVGQEGFAKLKKNTYLTVNQRGLDRAELDGTIGPAQYTANAYVNARKEVAVTVCVDPARAGADPIDPGTYVGSIQVVSREIQPVTIPITVTLQYPGYRWMVPLLAIVTLIAGSFVVWAHETRSKEDDSDVWFTERLQELPGWIARHYVGVFAGAIAAVGVFTASYWRSEAWGAKAPEDWLALLGAVFTAFTTALTAAAAIGLSKKRSRTRGQ
jgi:hypothetical protein